MLVAVLFAMFFTTPLPFFFFSRGQGLKELMILGLISFVLFVLKDQALYDQTDDVLTNTFDVRGNVGAMPQQGDAFGP